MSRADKILKQWRGSGGKGKAYSVTEVIAVLENSIDKEYLTFSKGGSHFCHIIHPKLNEITGVNELGILAVVRKGNKVWRWYIDRIIQAIDILDKEENQE
ncbi:MAG: hypothetical protein KAH48_07205 [Chlorobi bacterium]|nr:hypothetical protein [Chlorobiota bacterium]